MACFRNFDTRMHRRRSIRLKGYDYARPGAYFITLCINDREDNFFGKIENGVMILNEFGRIVDQVWFELPDHHPFVSLDEHVIMPDHFHGIVIIRDIPFVGAGCEPIGAGCEPAPTQYHGLPEIVRQFKTFSAKQINELRKTTGIPVWQRNYYEHVIRTNEIERIRTYIRNNPCKFIPPKQI